MKVRRRITTTVTAVAAITATVFLTSAPADAATVQPFGYTVNHYLRSSDKNTFIGGIKPTVATSGSEGHGLKMAAFETWMKGKYTVGPNADTHYQRMTITGFAQDPCFKKYTDVSDKVTQYPTPTELKSNPGAKPYVMRVDNASTDYPNNTCPQPRYTSPNDAAVQKTARPHLYPSPDGTVHPDSWYNPGSWNWGKIASDSWNHVLKPCGEGAASGLVGTGTGTLGANIIAKAVAGAPKVTVGPYGYAAVAIGGCVVGVIFGN